MITELPVERLRRVCDPMTIPCFTSEEMQSLETIVGQERAVRALHFGLDIKERGFNIYVAGRPGTGRTTAVKQFLEEIAEDKPVPQDWVYVNNFRDSARPEAISLPPGSALEFQAEMEALIKVATQDIRSAFESEEYHTHQDIQLKSFEQQKRDIFNSVNEKANQQGFVLQATPMGLLAAPTKDGKPLSEEEFMALPAAEKEEIVQKQQNVQTLLEASIRQAKGLDMKAREALQNLEREVARFAVHHLIEDLKEKHAGQTEVLDFLDQVREDIIENHAQFKAEPEEQAAALSAMTREMSATSLRKYKVNVLVDNSKLSGAPVVVETNPTYANLFGRIEQEARFGALITDFTLIRKGALHQANGGYLVAPVEEVLRNPFAWDSLKRALSDQEITVEDVGEKIGFITTKSLRPEPIPLDIKVILIGRPDIYRLLLLNDEQFDELFKVKADFDIQMDWTEANVCDYAAFVSTICRLENLKHLDQSALSRLVEHGARLAGDQEKLTTHFREIADVVREASHYAKRDGAQYVSAQHIKKAIDEHFYRSSLLRERVQDLIARGTIKIDVAGEKVGQVNGLSVIEQGDISFGQPSRITVSLGLGREGIINIEREADLSGPIHTKGVMILSGYLTEKFAQDRPLSLSARLVFEQSYSGVEGDSASSSELYALLSALSGLPIKQGVAVTGSVNQKGEVQSIGGVNEKIEGFFEICHLKGLTGEQGVIIPAGNVANLMLKDEVVEAVREGKFHIWPVETVDEGIQVLTGVRAGVRLEDGTFEEDTVYAKVDARLNEMAKRLEKFGKEEDKTSDTDEVAPSEQA